MTSNKSVKRALMKHSHNNYGVVNIGDHIQSCAAEQFISNVDFYIDRDQLNSPDIVPCKLIVNGWFTDAPQNWPLNPNIEPLFISFHLQPTSAEVILADKKNIEYLKKHSPIGCRDYKTVELLEQKGIEAYFSFCLTTTLGKNYKSDNKTDNIYFVDLFYTYDKSVFTKINWLSMLKLPPYKKLKKLKNYFSKPPSIADYIPSEIISSSTTLKHFVDNNKTNEELYDLAKGYLKKYAEAKLVVTSRIHCALPCLDLGTPVLFLMEGLKDESLHMSRLRGILDHMNILTLDSKEKVNTLFGKQMNVFNPNEIDWNNPPKNPESYSPLSQELINKCQKFMG
tara:strand:- start:208 stop:1224 length:1017 start_codon:yes stop_codon:yes gene_type:complete